MILIKDLNMPVSCANCTFNRYNVCLVKIKVSSIIGKPEWCPLIDAEKCLDAEYDRGFDSGLEYAGLEYAGKDELDEKEIYQQGYGDGLNDAWEAAKKISFPDDEGGIASENMVNVFGFTYWVHVMKKLTAAEAIAKIEAYEEKHKNEAEIHVGDEVIVNGLTGVVMKLDEKGNVDRYFTCDGRTFGNISGFQNNEVKKTGRHFPEVAKLLEKMKGEESNED